jgi:hypothetical protein
MPKNMVNYDSNWTRDTPTPTDQSCTYDTPACDQINDTEVAEHKEIEEETSNGYHNVPSGPVEYGPEN